MCGDFRGEKWNARGGGGDDWIVDGSVRMMCIFMEDAGWDRTKDGITSEASLASGHKSTNHTHFTRPVHLCALGNMIYIGCSPKRQFASPPESASPTHDGFAEITKMKGLSMWPFILPTGPLFFKLVQLKHDNLNVTQLFGVAGGHSAVLSS